MITKDYILRLAREGKRIDGRNPDEFRPATLQLDPVAKTEGSCLIKLGNTELIAGVKLDIKEPFPDNPDEGSLMAGAELSPLASPDFEKGPPREDGIELARIIDRGIRSADSIDVKKLCIEEGKAAWFVFLDIQILNHDGNLRDAGTLAGLAALKNSKMPGIKEGKPDYENRKGRLPISSLPISVTFAKVGDRLFADPIKEEEDIAEMLVTISLNESNNICSLHILGPISREDFNTCLEIATKRSQELRKLIP